MLIWDIDPVMLRLGGLEIRWYGLMFALSFLLGQSIMGYIYQAEKKPITNLDIATIYIVLGTFIGARLGAVFFYNFEYFSQHPLEIFLPITFEPTFRFTGFQGLASHGAFVGIVTAMYLYTNYDIRTRIWPPRFSIKRHSKGKQNFWWISDRLVIVVALAGCFIRIGNITNSELFGKPTHSRHGILFARDVTQSLKANFSAIKQAKVITCDQSVANKNNYQPITLSIALQHGSFEEKTVKDFLENHIKHALVNFSNIRAHIAEPPTQALNYTLSKNKQGSYVAQITTLGIVRHPVQLYESISCLILFLLLGYRWHSKRDTLRSGELTGIFLTVVFSLRIFYESLKPGKVIFENEAITILMPQALSFPLIILGLILLLYAAKTPKNSKIASSASSD